MKKIQILPAEVISAIAAGEVVERPAVVIKELIENAIDAGATKIEIDVDDRQIWRWRVTDNGHGILADELELAVQRHTTSKIATIADLAEISSLGFRGEALASIANVSRLTIASRPHQSDAGQQLQINHGQIESNQPLGLPIGTTVIVTDLFGQLPARRKFLKSAAAELKIIQEYVINQALAQPQITFRLIHNQQSLFHLPASDLKTRIQTLFGQTEFPSLVPVNQPQITGYVGTPQLARRTAPKQYLFINQRPVSPTLIHHWVKESYGALIEPRSEPPFVLFLELPPEKIDVNVHPRKEVIQFLAPTEIKEIVISAIKKSLQQTDLTYQYQPLNSAKTAWEVHDVVDALDRTASSATQSVLKQLVEPWKVTTEKPVILQLDFTYLITLTKAGLLIIDQHAAHERILYNQFLAALESDENRAKSAVNLPAPVTITLSQSDSQTLTENLVTLQNLGLEIDEFGQQTFRVTKVPAIMADRSIPQLLNEIIGDLTAEKMVKEVDTVAQRTVAYLACRTAVQAGDVLTESQRQLLFEKLAVTEHSFTCPHGRPTTITFSIRDLEKLFKRR